MSTESPPEWVPFFQDDEHGFGRGYELLEEDLAVIQMLDFLAADIRNRPERLQPLNCELIARITSLLGEVEVDLNVPLVADDE